jgi:hypothetical protein
LFASRVFLVLDVLLPLSAETHVDEPTSLIALHTMRMPILNMGRFDLIQTLLLSLTLFGAALVARHLSPAALDENK